MFKNLINRRSLVPQTQAHFPGSPGMGNRSADLTSDSRHMGKKAGSWWRGKAGGCCTDRAECEMNTCVCEGLKNPSVTVT